MKERERAHAEGEYKKVGRREKECTRARAQETAREKHGDAEKEAKEGREGSVPRTV